MKFTRSWVLFVSVLLAAGAWAQEAGALRGTVYAPGNEPLPEAKVEVVGTQLSTTTNEEGQFELEDVPAGRRQVKVSFTGYKDFTRRVQVVAGQVTSVDADLKYDEQFGEEIVVTGSKFREKKLESPVTVETISSKTIQLIGGTSYMNSIGQLKGVDYTDNGVYEKRVSTRGFNTQFNSRSITMVDGRLAQMPGNGLPQGVQLPTPNLDIKSTEVVVGPASALYGANAHAGVINILTKTPWDESGLTVALRGGNQYLGDATLRVAGTVDNKFGFKLNGQFTTATDFAPDRTINQATHSYGPATSPVFEGDLLSRYGVLAGKAEGFLYYRLGDWDFKGGYGFSTYEGIALTNAGRNHLRGWQIHYQTVSASHSNWFAHVTRTYSNAGGTYQLDALASTVRRQNRTWEKPSELDALRDEIKFVDDSQLIDSELQYRNEIGDLKFITGLQLRLYNPSSQGTYLADVGGRRLSVTEFGGYLQADYTLLRDKLKVVAAGRVDTHTNYSPQISPKAALVYTLTKNQNLRVGYNRAFKSPTILENFLLISNTLVGNRTGFIIRDAEGNELSRIDPLVPEEVNALEVGYKASFDNKLVVDLVAHHSWFQNFISPLTARANPAQGTFAYYADTGEAVAAGTPAEGTLSTYSNFGRSRVAGADLGLDYMLTPNINLNGSVSYMTLLSFRNTAPGQGALLLNVPELKLKAAVTVQDLVVQNSFIRLSGRYQSAYEFASGRWNSRTFFEDGKIPARFVADLGVGYRFENGLALTGNVYNLLNDRGVDVLGAPPSGILANLELSYRFDGLNF